MIDRTDRCFRGGRRQAILDVAWKIFSKEGYAATSMSHIAAQLGGSKGTLYNYFHSKEELFEAHIQDRCRYFAESIFVSPIEEDDPARLLTKLAERMLTIMLSDESMDFYRLVIAEAARNPAIGKALYESGPSSGITLIAQFLERSRLDGLIDIDDSIRAAEEFFSLIHGNFHLKRLLNIIPTPSIAQIENEAARVAKTFLRIYGVKPDSSVHR